MGRHYNHFFVYPSAKPYKGSQAAIAWAERGYVPCVGVDSVEDLEAIRKAVEPNRYVATLFIYDNGFPGYYKVINGLVEHAFNCGADLVTVGGDDQLPPPVPSCVVSDIYFDRFPNGDGIMQCAGDKQGELIGGLHNAARICGSPTFGKGWYKNAFGGAGPFGNFGFKSFYCDELLKEVSERLGLLWMNFDLTIDHVHWAFGRAPRQDYHVRAEGNWNHDKEIFDKLKAADFKPCLDLWGRPAEVRG